MRVVHLAYYYGLNNTGGAAIASTRLHNVMVESGVDSHYVCVHQMEDGKNIHVAPPRGLGRLFYLWGGRFLRKALKLVYPRGQTFLCLIPLFGLERTLRELKPDVLHVHWLNADVMSLRQLAKLPYPIVFHLHDIWLLNGFGPYPNVDTRYRDGFTSANSDVLERWLWNRKREAVASLHPTFVGPSDWICNICRASVIGKGASAYTVANVYDSRFYYQEKKRSTTDRFRILFGCFAGTQSRIKGWEDLAAALRLLPDAVRRQVEIHVFGEKAEPRSLEDMPMILHGVIRDPNVMVDLYHSCDVFALPSKEDNAPSTKFEALLCGLPVLAFKRTGCAEWIEHQKNGWVAADGDLAAYAAGFQWYYEMWKSGGIDHATIAKRATRAFGSAKTIEALVKVYKEKVEGWRLTAVGGVVC